MHKTFGESHDRTERDDLEDAKPESSVKQIPVRGLSPAVEKMFGALLDEPAAAGAQSDATPDARRAARSGAA